VKPTQKCTTVIWCNKIFDISAQYELFRMIKYNKTVACASKLQCVEYE